MWFKKRIDEKCGPAKQAQRKQITIKLNNMDITEQSNKKANKTIHI
jgi:hypothetical protein